MDTFYGVIYYKNGGKKQLGYCSGAGAEQQCERQTAQQFEIEKKLSTSEFSKPTRYEVKKK